MMASIVAKAHKSYSNCPVIPTRVESLVWTKPERNWLDKMWLDSGVGELYLSPFLGNQIIVEGDAPTLYLNLRILFLSWHYSRMK